ncbi:hypothetical protein CFOL_v3_02236 [Cephalotus follicularis]|uniref:Uncharacterized protein n=1 Tax=Cephalotus follicularis TaxID=3775 RepID=A0A1Q3AT07_CEPFO|nr:hypothetical protein CFOL_v3_02236 [Cephalotus follicularis]
MWRVKMRALLIQQEVLGAVDGEEGLPEDMLQAEKKRILNRAHTSIQLCLEDDVLHEFVDETTVVGLWNKLESRYMTKSLTNRLYCKQRTTRKRVFADRQSGRQNIKSGRRKVSPTAPPTALTAAYNWVTDYSPTVLPTAFFIRRPLKRSGGKAVAVDC